MPTVDVVDLTNNKVGELELADEVFGAEVNEALLYEAVRQFQAGKHTGNHKTKTRSEVAGSGKKLWKQKGTGRARVGSVRSPIWRHGGTVHGPVVRDYSYKLPRKMLLGALRSALSAKVKDGELKVVHEFNLADHKTRNAMDALANLATGKTVLVVDNGENRNLTPGSAQSQGRDPDPHPRRQPLPSAGPPERADLGSGCPEIFGGARKMTLYEVIHRPLVTEKGVDKKDNERTLCFEVALGANKTQVKAAVEKLFKVKVAEVRTATFDGKLRRRGKFAGYRSEWKKAYVKLKEGQKVPEFAEI